MTNEVRKEILKELPRGAVVTYHGPSQALHGKVFLKLSDKSDKMEVVGPKSHVYRLKYYNLSCEPIRIAQEVACMLNTGLPF